MNFRDLKQELGMEEAIHGSTLDAYEVVVKTQHNSRSKVDRIEVNPGDQTVVIHTKGA